MNITKSLELYERALKVIPGGAQTLSKQYGRFVRGVAPVFIKEAGGCMVVDADGNFYIDWSASLGPIILGYKRVPLLALPDDPLLPLPHVSEVELAEKLVNIIPCAEMVRFFKSGSDATSAAVRLSRYITGRDAVVAVGFHGWHDWYASTLPPPKNGGCVDLDVSKVPYGNLEALEAKFHTVEPACLIMEPMSRQCPELASSEYLSKVKDLCTAYKVILIFDEIIMGFRYSIAGGQTVYGVTPDLATYSKAMANGYPISALVGKADLMKEIAKLQISGTYFGDITAIAAALYTIDKIEKWKVIPYLHEIGGKLSFGITQILLGNDLCGIVTMKGWGPWSSLVWNNVSAHHFFLQEIFKRGIFYNRDHFATFAHEVDDVKRTLSIYEEVFGNMKKYIDDGTLDSKLEGEFNEELLK